MKSYIYFSQNNSTFSPDIDSSKRINLKWIWSCNSPPFFMVKGDGFGEIRSFNSRFVWLEGNKRAKIQNILIEFHYVCQSINGMVVQVSIGIRTQ